MEENQENDAPTVIRSMYSLGPHICPMVYGIAFCPLSKSEVLKTLGCADSKQLTEEKRDAIFDKINIEDYAHESMGWAVDVISPNYISNSMLKRSKHSLNEVSMDSAIALIQKAIDAGVNVQDVYVDTVGPPEKYQAKLKKIFPKLEIVVAKKADSTYPIVSAASICAKVSRDQALKFWKFGEGLELTQKDFGSGYPGDPSTKSFIHDRIDKVFGYPHLVRFSWSTADNALASTAYECEWESAESDDENEDPKKKAKRQSLKNVPKISSFFGGNDGSNKRKRHKFFTQRCLVNVAEL
ncbi:ribonuclease H2 subunit A-like [Ctenocephalides felis]|uniref:ribonuclease H2 subunit A-like n=1 Tax=Ctenocephalides felis TaxID=7515 RepID=UPI000E6E1931|nr:ribonuclease H2 subunit A-like [Ctenocephalides felis]